MRCCDSNSLKVLEKCIQAPLPRYISIISILKFSPIESAIPYDKAKESGSHRSPLLSWMITIQKRIPTLFCFYSCHATYYSGVVLCCLIRVLQASESPIAGGAVSKPRPRRTMTDLCPPRAEALDSQLLHCILLGLHTCFLLSLMPVRFGGGQGSSSEGWEVDQAKLATALAVVPCTEPGAELTFWIQCSLLTHHG